jgi:CheY-like chemotaxis protein
LENDLSILLVSNDLDFSFHLRSFLGDILSRTHLRFTRSERETTTYLRGVGIYSNRFCYPFPDLLLVDIEDGVDSNLSLIQWVRQHAAFSLLPIILLTNGNNDLEIQDSFDVGANSFIVKRHEPERLHEVIVSILELKHVSISTSSPPPSFA